MIIELYPPMPPVQYFGMCAFICRQAIIYSRHWRFGQEFAKIGVTSYCIKGVYL